MQLQPKLQMDEESNVAGPPEATPLQRLLHLQSTPFTAKFSSLKCPICSDFSMTHLCVILIALSGEDDLWGKIGWRADA